MRAFTIMPFNEEFDDVFQLGIKKPALDSKVDAYRLDEELFDEGMLDKIYKEIEKADFIIADLSDKNPNVFYELGYAHALGKLCILITKDAENIPFDLKHRRHIVYGESLVHLEKQIKKNIDWAKGEIDNNKNNPFVIEVKTSGSLTTTEEYAEGKIDFSIDIENKSSKTSPEIHGVYLYSVSKWNIKQNGRNVPFRKSTKKSFQYKYNLNIETPKLPKDGWTTIEISAVRYLALLWENDKIEDSYTIAGNVLLEVVTEKGAFSKNLPISVVVDSLPF